MILIILKIIFFALSIMFTAIDVGTLVKCASEKRGIVYLTPMVISWTIFYALYQFS